MANRIPQYSSEMEIVERLSNGRHYLGIYKVKSGESFAECPFIFNAAGQAKSNKHVLANAYLVAAAPELLKALKECEDHLAPEVFGDLLKTVRSTIAIAEGRG